MSGNSIDSLASYAIIVPIVIGVLWWLMASRRGDARVESGTAIVDYGRPMKGLTIVFLLFPLAIAVLSIVSPPKYQERWIPLQLILGFLAIALPLALEVFRRRLRLEEDVLVSESPWTGMIRVPWSEITSVSYQQSMSWYVIDSRGSRRVRVASFMSGLGTLAAMLAKRTANVPAIQSGLERMQARREVGLG
jgi:hypothetical protein